MARQFRWTNPSVVAFAGSMDPVEVMEGKARELVLEAMDGGWRGPPFDPLALAQQLSIRTEARGDIPDARTVPQADGSLVLEYNPLRPRGRLRFSVAHELAHSLFADCAEAIRNRSPTRSYDADEWQLEMLCNIGAAELLMPLGSFSEFAERKLSIDSVMALRKEFDVSAEACLIRVIKLTRSRAAAFCASKHSDGRYKVDYVIPSQAWSSPIVAGQLVPPGSAVEDANAIGFTAVGKETWGNSVIHVECVGLAPYPGALTPRVVGLLLPKDSAVEALPEIVEVSGNALEPRGSGPKLIAHVIPNVARPWGGAGFASKVKRAFPAAWEQFKRQTIDARKPPLLGQVFIVTVSEDLSVAHMVAQSGIGQSPGQRLKYAALAECLLLVQKKALELGASVHMPRVGTGHGGANWEVVRELISEELVGKGVATTVYSLPT